MKAITNPNSLLREIAKLEPSNSEYIVVVLDGEYNITAVVSANEENYKATVATITDLKYEAEEFDSATVFLRGKDTYNPENKDAYITFIEDNSNFHVLDAICVDWVEGTHYSDMCNFPSSCCGPDNQMTFRLEEDALV